MTNSLFRILTTVSDQVTDNVTVTIDNEHLKLDANSHTIVVRHDIGDDEYTIREDDYDVVFGYTRNTASQHLTRWLLKNAIDYGTCAECGQKITSADQHVNASVYGVHFHLRCIDEPLVLRVLKALDLDDIGYKGGRLIRNSDVYARAGL